MKSRWAAKNQRKKTDLESALTRRRLAPRRVSMHLMAFSKLKHVPRTSKQIDFGGGIVGVVVVVVVVGVSW